MESMVSNLISIVAPCVSAIASCIAIYVTHKKQGNMDAYKKVCDEFGISTTLARLQEHEGMTV